MRDPPWPSQMYRRRAMDGRQVEWIIFWHLSSSTALRQLREKLPTRLLHAVQKTSHLTSLITTYLWRGHLSVRSGGLSTGEQSIHHPLQATFVFLYFSRTRHTGSSQCAHCLLFLSFTSTGYILISPFPAASSLATTWKMANGEKFAVGPFCLFCSILIFLCHNFDPPKKLVD